MGRRRRLAAVASGALLAAAMLAGCAAEASGPPVLNFYTPADNASGYAAAAEACTAEAGGRYRVVQQTLPKSADDQRLQLARRLVAGDPAVDLMGLDVIWTAEFAEAGWIEPWPEDAAAAVTEGTLKGPLETAMYQGRLWAAPLNTNTQLLWYRTDLAPTPPQTWDEMIDMSERLNQQGLPSYIEVQGAQYEGIVVWFNTLMTSAGGQIVSEDGKVLLDDGDAARQAVEIMHRVATSPAADPSLSVAQENDGRLAMEAGLAAFQVNYPFVNASINTPPPDGGGGGTFIDEQGRPTNVDTGRRVVDVFAWAPYPRVDPNEPATVTIGGLNIGVSTTGGDQGLAFEAAQCLRNRENQLRNALEGGVPPTLEALYDDPAFQQEYPAWEAIRNSLQNASVRPKTPAYTSISIVLADLLNPPMQINPETIVPVMAEQVERAVNSEGLVP
ncbi:ABC transporter substrate-binding protein [Pseudonocardia asaccharolytica DSM 44247 = NBRC 16224]|uniref:ABC transporter substrate-binding protein n=1 Tax=Pseudonocardia asaccharolytica DSM 44247 = NBRC 16224 TaxID=1123024 RepID=A0A511DD41_9PSEU|nr:ABC transporter substrate-binding protein [Pseudonocardia asaccharolytica DSM 44247 = NBRC 16224]